MLTIIKSMRELSFGKLMEVYTEGNQENAADLYPGLPEGQRLLRAEQDFWQYLNEVFFRTPGGVYCVWQEGGVYVSALRLEPYHDGLLLEALETAPGHRKQGYAAMLIRAVQEWLAGQGRVKVYSHIGHRNAASIAVHQKCGFRKVLDHGVYADGSVTNRAGTYLFVANL